MSMKMVVSIDEEGAVRVMCASDSGARAAMEEALANLSRNSQWEHVTADYGVAADGGRLAIKKIVAWNGDMPPEDADSTDSYEVFEPTLGNWLEI